MHYTYEDTVPKESPFKALALRLCKTSCDILSDQIIMQGVGREGAETSEFEFEFVLSFPLQKKMADESYALNSSNFNDLEDVLGFDVTDDFEELNEAQEEIADNSSNIGFGQVQREELEAVLSRIATESCNIPEEFKIASRTLSIITCSESQEKSTIIFSLCSSSLLGFVLCYNKG